ncbi:LOW QUALITY PROTEIN: hypothetical protein RJ639_019698, partial [Escallonia herrerae]
VGYGSPAALQHLIHILLCRRRQLIAWSSSTRFGPHTAKPQVSLPRRFSGSFPPSMANASRLLVLSMSWNNFAGPIPTNLGNLRDLEYLQLNVNQFGSNKQNDLSFIVSLTNCTNLRSIPQEIGNLKTLWLGSNKISGSIPQEIGNLHNLYFLEIVNNMISGSIPETIGKLSKLQKLGIVVNNISGKIPSSIGNITGLRNLGAAANMLEGRIPAELGNCTNLQELYLGSNHLTGKIPEQVIGISSLTIGLYLELNEFTGPLPSQVGNLKNLGALSISGNKLTGEIPSVLVPRFAWQFLDGAIPSSLNQLKGIRELDLSQNNLSGQIPEFLGKLPLMRLNLSHNTLEGEVPKVGVFNNISAFSVAGKNMKLCGGIQPLHLLACPIKFSKKNKIPFPDKMIPLLIILPIVLLLAWGGEGEFAKLKSCLESILRLGVIYSAKLPHERMDSGNVVKEIHQITKAYNE